MEKLKSKTIISKSYLSGIETYLECSIGLINNNLNKIGKGLKSITIDKSNLIDSVAESAADVVVNPYKINRIYVSDYYYDVNTSDVTAIKNAISASKSNDVIVFDGVKTYSITETIALPSARSIEGNGCKWQAELSNSYTKGYMLSINSDDCELYSWKDSYPLPGAYVKGVKFYGRDGSTSIHGIFCASNVKLCDLFFHYLAKFIQTSYLYLDQIEWNTITGGTRTDTSQYCLDTGFAGDLRIIESVGVSEEHALRIGGSHKSINVNRFIGGGIDIFGGTLAKISNSHFTSLSQIRIQQNPSVIIDNCHFVKHPTAPQIFITNASSSRHPSVIISNCRFVYLLSIENYDHSSNYYEVYLDKDCVCDVIIENCNKYSGAPTDSSAGIYYGIKTNLDNFSASSRKNSHFYKLQNKIGDNLDIVSNYTMPNIITSSGSYVSSHYEFNGIDGTYYYTCSLVLDYNRKLGIAGYSTGISLSPSQKTGAAYININDEAFTQSNCDFIIYRGTTNGIWINKCTVAPFNKCLIDSGYMVGGNAWEDCNGLDDFNLCTKIETDGVNVTAYMSKIPTLGKWIVGDKIINTTPIAGGYIGWICVASGDFAGVSPVFKEYCKIQS